MFRGKLRDTVLDWEDSLPTKEMETAEYHSKYVHLRMHAKAKGGQILPTPVETLAHCFSRNRISP